MTSLYEPKQCPGCGAAFQYVVGYAFATIDGCSYIFCSKECRNQEVKASKEGTFTPWDCQSRYEEEVAIGVLDDDPQDIEDRDEYRVSRTEYPRRTR